MVLAIQKRNKMLNFNYRLLFIFLISCMEIKRKKKDENLRVNQFFVFGCESIISICFQCLRKILTLRKIQRRKKGNKYLKNFVFCGSLFFILKQKKRINDLKIRLIPLRFDLPINFALTSIKKKQDYVINLILYVYREVVSRD